MNGNYARLESRAYYELVIYCFPLNSRHFPVSDTFGTTSMIPETAVNKNLVRQIFQSVPYGVYQ